MADPWALRPAGPGSSLRLGRAAWRATTAHTTGKGVAATVSVRLPGEGRVGRAQAGPVMGHPEEIPCLGPVERVGATLGFPKGGPAHVVRCRQDFVPLSWGSWPL